MNTYTTVPSGEQVVQELPWRWKVQGRIFLIGGLGFMFDAWDVTLNGILIPLLSRHWSLTPGEAAWIGASNLIGMALGAFIWGTIADTIGRKKAFTATLLIFSIFTVLGAFSPDFLWFVAFRFMAGFGLGGCIPVDYALVGEFTPRKQRGKVLTAMDGWWPIGAALCGFVSAGLVALYGDWRLTMMVMVLPALLVFWVRRSVPESPLFLIRKGRREEAAKVFRNLVALDETLHYGHAGLGAAALERGDLVEAEGYLRRAAACGVADEMVFVNLGEVLVRSGRVDEGREMLEKAPGSGRAKGILEAL